MRIDRIEYSSEKIVTIPWTASKVPTVRRELLESHPYSDRIEVVQEPFDIFIYYTGLAHPYRIRAEVGYAFDYASIPRCFSWILDYKDDRLSFGALAHDIPFNHKYGTLEFASTLIKDISIDRGYPRVKANLVYWAVRGNIARRMWNNRDAFDLENSKFSSIGMVNIGSEYNF